MHRKPLAAIAVIGAVVGALVVGASVAYAADSAQPVPTRSTNRGWDTPPRDAVDQLG